MPERAYLSIGEVLSSLKDEFPDITISKIRFLESQGLLDPERTPSGYRKFYEADVERLRWILRQQRENFLPLKVIKGRLGSDEDARDADAPVPAEVPSAPEPAAPAAGARKGAAARPRPTAPSPPQLDFAPVLSAGMSGAVLTIEELAGSAELEVADIEELERYGLLAGRPVAGVVYYDEEALVVARAAAGFRRVGVEARHLRMFKNAAEREAGFLEQVVTPLMKQRNPKARQQALDTLGELSRLGQSLRGSLLRQALRDYTGG